MNETTSAKQVSGLAGLSTLTNKQQKQLTIVRVENGYTLTPAWNTGEPKVAMLLNEMLELVKEYFEDKQ